MNLALEILVQIAQAANYETYLNLRSSCVSLSRLLALCKTVGFEEYKEILGKLNLQVEPFLSDQQREDKDKVIAKESVEDEDFADEIHGGAEAEESDRLPFFYWNRAKRECMSNSRRLYFQKRIILDLSQWAAGFSSKASKKHHLWRFTKEVYYYVCGNFLIVQARGMIEKMLNSLRNDTRVASRIQTLLKVGPSCRQYTIPYSLGLSIISQDSSLLVRLLSLNPSILDGSCHDSVINYALDEELLDAVLSLFEVAGPRLDPNINDGLTLITAARLGHVSLVRRLLQDPRVDPTMNDSLPMRVAVRWEREDVVRLLVEDGRCQFVEVEAENINTEASL